MPGGREHHHIYIYIYNKHNNFYCILQMLAEGLREWECCGHPLQLSDVNREVRQGLASLLYVPCQCGFMNKVYTSKSHRDKSKMVKGKPIYVNSKMALGNAHICLLIYIKFIDLLVN